MTAKLDEALDAGLLGMSGMDSAIDKLDGDRYRSRGLPSTFATWRERRKLIAVLRKRAPDAAERTRRRDARGRRCCSSCPAAGCSAVATACG